MASFPLRREFGWFYPVDLRLELNYKGFDCVLTWIIHESSLPQMVGSACEVWLVRLGRWYSTAILPQPPRCGEIGSPEEEKISNILEYNDGKIKLLCVHLKYHVNH